MGNKNINQQSLDQLSQFNDLIRLIIDNKNLADIINNIKDQQDSLKKQYDDLSNLKVMQDASAKDLADQTQKNLKSISDLNDAKSDSDASKNSAAASIEKSQILLKSLAQAQSIFDANSKNANDALSEREADISQREIDVKNALDSANALKDEYEEKLDALKKLAGS